MTMYLVFSAFASRPIPLLKTNKASVFVDIVAGIKKKRLEVIGHTLKMDHEIVVNKTGENTPKGRKEWEDQE
jgi:hypothetical protein